MDEGKTNELITYLADIAFKSERLEPDIRENISQGLPRFSVRYERYYGKEKMFYDLRFRKDHQFDAYRLEGYKATYRKPVEIESQIINEVDTRELESRMKEIDWHAHFEKPSNIPDDRKTAKIISDLLTLDYKHDQEGIRIQELLQFKYFPARYYDENLKELQSQFDKSREFGPTENGFCSSHLAYHLLSGRLDELHEKLQFLELSQYPGVDVYAELETILSRNPDPFELKYLRNEPEADAEYIVPVTKVDGRYSVDTYTATLTPYPPLEHGLYNGIDTRKLEAEMREIDWHNDRELFTLYEDNEPELKAPVEEIISQINQLSKEPNGLQPAELLKLKYWSDASFLDSFIDKRTWNYLESLPKRIQEFPVEISVKAAFNLLCGRAILNTSPLRQGEETGTWMKLDLSHKDENNNYPLKTMEGFSLNDLEKLLNLLPIDGMDFYTIRNGLKGGDLLSVRLNNGRKVLLQANPEQKTIDIFTPDMHPIYTNLKLDPDWKPSVMQKENELESNQKIPSKSKQNYFSKQSTKRHKKGRRM